MRNFYSEEPNERVASAGRVYYMSYNELAYQKEICSKRDVAKEAIIARHIGQLLYMVVSADHLTNAISVDCKLWRMRYQRRMEFKIR